MLAVEPLEPVILPLLFKYCTISSFPFVQLVNFYAALDRCKLLYPLKLIKLEFIQEM